nr:ribonuclease H-like domain-containing protein [Tanacetum cinerariifolium]
MVNVAKIQVRNGLGPKEKLTILFLVHGNPQHDLKDKGVINSGCSRRMTENMSYLFDFKELNGGYVAFGGNLKGGKISGKDENQVLLRVPRENNMYNVDLNNTVPSRDLTCLFAKATLDESNLWHRRLGHINFKTMNKLNTDGDAVFGGTKWVFRNEKDERDIVFRNKARLVAQGHTQEEGIDYEEVFAQVAKIEAI